MYVMLFSDVEKNVRQLYRLKSPFVYLYIVT